MSFKYAPGFSDAYVRAIERENQGSEDQDMEIKVRYIGHGLLNGCIFANGRER